VRPRARTCALPEPPSQRSHAGLGRLGRRRRGEERRRARLAADRSRAVLWETERAREEEDALEDRSSGDGRSPEVNNNL